MIRRRSSSEGSKKGRSTPGPSPAAPGHRGARRLAAPFAAAVLCAATVLTSASALAHPLAPALFELKEQGPGRTAALWRTSRLQPRGARIRPTLAPDCRALGEPDYREVDQAVEVRWELDCGSQGLVGRRIAVEGLEGANVEALVRVELADGRAINRMLRAREPSLEIPARQTRGEVMRVYAALGVEHILLGADHLFFVLGLLLLIEGSRRLVQTITAFTLGHSLTLSLAALGFTNVPPGPVELLIAISVLLLAVELAQSFDPERPPGPISKRPWLMGAGFGLLHGMGFAGALREIGLPQEEIPIALFSFNVGIEIGQLLFVGLVLGVLYTARPWLARAPRWISPMPAYVLGSMAAFWCYERGAAIFGA